MQGQNLLLSSIIVSYVGEKADTGNADPQKTNQLKKGIMILQTISST